MTRLTFYFTLNLLLLCITTLVSAQQDSIQVAIRCGLAAEYCLPTNGTPGERLTITINDQLLTEKNTCESGTNGSGILLPLELGDFKVAVKDDNGAAQQLFIQVIEEMSEPMPLEVTPEHISCAGKTDGTLDFNFDYPKDFVQPAEVLITDGKNTFENGSLPAGSYCVQILNGQSCLIAQGCTDILEPWPFQVAPHIIPACEQKGGVIQLHLEQEENYYTYDWHDVAGGENQRDREALPPGKYAVTITDLGGCQTVLNPLLVREDCRGEITLPLPPADLYVDCGELPAPPELTAASTCPKGGLKVNYFERRDTQDCKGGFRIVHHWVASDACGNIDTVVQNVFVNDDQAPEWIDQLADVRLQKGQMIPIIPQPRAKDVCDLHPQTIFEEAINMKDCQTEIIRTWTAYDDCGNTSELSQTIYWEGLFERQTDTICQGDTIYYGGQAYFDAGTKIGYHTSSQGCDSIFESIITFLPISECDFVVFAGDTDSNRVVNIYDVMNIGLGYGRTGPRRFSQTTNWQPLRARKWKRQSAFDQINFRHADANGDGRIDHADLEIIDANWTGQADSAIIAPNQSRVIALGMETTTAVAGQPVRLKLSVGQTHNPLDEVYAVMIPLELPIEQIEPTSWQFEPSPKGTFGRPDSMLVFTKWDESTQRLWLAVSRTDGQGIAFGGELGELIFQILPAFQNDDETFVVSSSEGQLLTTDGQRYGLNASELQFLLAPDIQLSAAELEAAVGIQYHAELDHLEAILQPEVKLIALHFLNERGQRVRGIHPRRGIYNLEALARGIYKVRIETNHGTVLREIILPEKEVQME